MDFIRTRAIPALIAALAAFGAHAACESLDGTYRYETAGTAPGRPRYLSDFTFGPERRKVVTSEAPASRTQGLGSDQLRSRPKVTHLAVDAKLSASADGATLEFHDAHGKTLATMDIGKEWHCRGNALVRESERTSGLHDDIRTEKVQERLSRDGRDLLFSESATSIEPADGKQRHKEVRFAAMK